MVDWDDVYDIVGAFILFGFLIGTIIYGLITTIF